PSIPPEQLLRALVLQSLYTVRSERLLMEEIDYSVLFRWFVGLGMDDPMVADDVQQKSRPPARERHCQCVLRRGPRTGTRGGSALGRTLHRRWHAARSLGESQELPPQA